MERATSRKQTALSNGRATHASREAAKRRGMLQSVSNAFDILALFTKQRPAWTLTEIVRELDLDQSSAFRLLSTMEAKGILTRRSRMDPYRVALHLWRVGCTAFERDALASTVPVILARLTEVTGETSYCSVAEGRLTVAIDVHVARGQGKATVYPYAPGEDYTPLHAPAAGKAILATWSDEEIDEYVAGGLERVGFRTITDSDDLRAHLHEVREQGYAVNNDETLPGEISIAAAVFGGSGEAIAAISITGPSLWDLDRHPAFGRQVKSVADEATLLLRQRTYAFPE
jgi:DNA-binding IclR family transcriptional regulator